MIVLKYNEIYRYCKTDSDPHRWMVVKKLIKVLKEKKQVVVENQNVIFQGEAFKEFEWLWNLHNRCMEICCFSHCTKDNIFRIYQKIYSSFLNKQRVSCYAIFCPGYSGKSYKRRVGHTTINKLKGLVLLEKLFTEIKINIEIKCIYADIFLENEITDENITDFNYNKNQFWKVANTYFSLKNIELLSQLLKSDTEQIFENSFVDTEAIEQINNKTYDLFWRCNRKFYSKFDWSIDKIKLRNDQLVTLYLKVADYISQKGNAFYLPMENMDDRSIIFSKMDVPVLFIKNQEFLLDSVEVK